MKIQGTLTGFDAWAFERLRDSKDWSPADTARFILVQWLNEPNNAMLTKLGITDERYWSERGGGGDVKKFKR